MTGTRILAAAGRLSALVGTLGGFLDFPHALGYAAGIMLAGNLGALLWTDKEIK